MIILELKLVNMRIKENIMVKRVYYIENSIAPEKVLETLKTVIPCFINREYIEMDFSEVEVIAREEDFRTVENLLSPLI